MNLVGVGLALGVGLLTARVSAPAPPPSTTEAYTLDNGLRVVLRDEPAVSAISVRVLYAWGWRDDQPGRQGSAHLLEHMLFRRTAHLPKSVHAELSRLGAVNYNGTTTADYLQLYETVPVESLDAILRLESERMGFPVFDSQELGREKLIVQRERIERLQQNDWAVARREVRGRLFPPEHPLHPASDATTAKVSVPQLRRLTAKAIIPNNAVLVLAGDLPDGTRDRIDQYFAPLRRGDPINRQRQDPPPLTQDVRVSIPGLEHTPKLVLLGWHAPHRGHPLSAAGQLTAALLNRRHRRRRAGDEARPGGSTLFLSAQYTSELGHSVFYFGVLGGPRTEPAALTAELDAALDDLQTHPPTAQELASAKKRTAVRIGRQLDTLSMQTEVLAESAAEGVPDAVESMLRPIQRVESEDVLRFVAEYLRGSSGRVQVIQVPAEAR